MKTGKSKKKPALINGAIQWLDPAKQQTNQFVRNHDIKIDL